MGQDATRDEVQNFFDVLMTTFAAGITKTGSFYTDFTTTIDVAGEVSIHRWMTQMPGLREWVGDRIVNDLSTEGMTVVSKLWENTIGIDKFDLRDDSGKAGLYAPLVARQVQSANRHKDNIASALIKANTAIGYDLKPLFATDHPTEGQAAQSNLLSGGGGGGPFYIYDSTEAMKMVLLQNTDDLTQTAITDPESEIVFKTHKFQWGVEARYDVAPGFWQSCVRSEAATIDETSIDAAIVAMSELYDSNGDPLGQMPDTIMVRPRDRLAAEKALKDTLIATGGTNTLQRTGLIQRIVVNPYLTV